ncbi:Alanyl-tRNA synthetase [gamma proteobacterium IMCC2047]|nr:Alanyl-tRNA synthetase [gamma proteobacterium IMCC2047]
MKSSDIRNAFLDFLVQQGHERLASSSLVPGNDPTLLFTNAGMVQFKELFLGNETRSYTRATTSQRCVRAGGKHNDLENVGYTARHHTFFEMLGNFSFGDYFKVEAIKFAWTFLTEVMGLPEEKLWVTVYEEDDEAADIWLKDMGVSAERFSRLGKKDNFWSMGDTGPCGPCTEIFYDHGEEVAGGPPGSPDEDGDRYIEIWNLVFMQFERAADGTMTPLPKPSVDTGMGLERIAAVMQGVHNNYEIDLFQTLLKRAAEVVGVSDTSNTSLRVIADHIRSCSFLVSDGVIPSNDGRGYVLRRIIRRAIRHGHKLGMKDAFFHKIVSALVDEMGEAYPELVTRQAQIEQVLAKEEEQFAKTLDQGMQIFERDLSELKGNEIPGETIFRLYDTYGFPVDLTADIARERNLIMDIAGFEQAMQEQRERARAASSFDVDMRADVVFEGETDFCGYDLLTEQCQISALVKEGDTAESLIEGDTGVVVLDHTPFYAESGGQVGDVGTLQTDEAVFRVTNTVKQAGTHLHQGVVERGSFTVGTKLVAEVDTRKRQATALNHSASHLLHAALRDVLGEHVAQKGSLVSPERLRFDFSHFEAVTAQQLSAIEAMVNDKIQANSEVGTELMALEDAMNSGVTALFGEKYSDEVRVLSMADGFSVELCGGTHVNRTGDIAVFKIISESGVAAGVRRIEAVTGNAALTYYQNLEQDLTEIAGVLKSAPEQTVEKVQLLASKNRQLEKELAALKAKLVTSSGRDLASEAVELNGVKVLAHAFEGVDGKTLLSTMDQLKSKLGTAVIVLATAKGDKVSLVAGVTKDATDRVKAGELVNMVAGQVGGKGGGRPDMAQAGGNQPEAIPAALASVVPWLEQRL